MRFCTVAHLTAATALRQLDPEFEAVAASLKVPVWVTFGGVTVPICLPAILEIWVFLFVSAMTTVSAGVFVYGPGTRPASVALLLHMHEVGQAGAAAAMACVLLAAAMAAKLAQLAVGAMASRATLPKIPGEFVTKSSPGCACDDHVGRQACDRVKVEGYRG